MFSSKEAAEKNLGALVISKILEPGNRLCRIVNIQLGTPPFDASATSIELTLEGPDMGDSFEGFLVDRDDPHGPRYRGQVAMVRATQYPFKDYNNDGKFTAKDQLMFRWLCALATALGLTEQLANDDIKGDTITEYFNNIKPYLVKADRWIWFTIAGEEYEKNGYIQYHLNLAKRTRTEMPFVLAERDEKGELIKTLPAGVLVFDPSQHIRKKRSAEAVESFAGSESGMSTAHSDTLLP